MLAEPHPDLREGQIVDGYRLGRSLGQGGMGEVFEAVHTLTRQQVAIKFLLPKFAGDPAAARRFLNEARAVSVVKHPSVVLIHHYGQLPDGAAYIVMEHLDGQTLRQHLKDQGDQGRLPWQRALDLVRQMALALAAAHEKGVVHRDLKPENVMIVKDPDEHDRTKILDFGIAKVAAELFGGESQHTATGAVIGTWTYIAPEQLEGMRQVTGKADVYSLGCILYEMLAGRPPFRSEEAFQAAVLVMRLHKDAPPLRKQAPLLPPAVAKLTHRMLERQPEGRPTMTALAAEIASLLAGKRPPLPWKYVVIAGSALALLLGLGGVVRHAWPPRTPRPVSARVLKVPHEVKPPQEARPPQEEEVVTQITDPRRPVKLAGKDPRKRPRRGARPVAATPGPDKPDGTPIRSPSPQPRAIDLIDTESLK